MVKPRDAICLHMVSLVTDGVTDERRRMPISRNKKSCHVLLITETITATLFVFTSYLAFYIASTKNINVCSCTLNRPMPTLATRCMFKPMACALSIHWPVSKYDRRPAIYLFPYLLGTTSSLQTTVLQTPAVIWCHTARGVTALTRVDKVQGARDARGPWVFVNIFLLAHSYKILTHC